MEGFDRRLIAVTVIVAYLLASAVPVAADHGPLPDTDPAKEGADRAHRNTVATATAATDLAARSADEAQQAAQKVLDGLQNGDVVVPLSNVNNTRDAALAAADQAIVHSVDSGKAIDEAQEGQRSEIRAFADLMTEAALHRLGRGQDPTSQPFSSAQAPDCRADIQAAIDDAVPGDEIRICPGTYEGPVTVGTHFLHIEAPYGPAATVIEAADAGFVVTASGVTIKGFGIVGADRAGVQVGTPDGHGGPDGVVGTTVVANEFRYNVRGVQVHKAPGTVVAANTFRAARVAFEDGGFVGGTGVEVTEPTGDPVDVDEIREDALGVVVAANNFVDNSRHAVRSDAGTADEPSLPTVAAVNYHGTPLGPNVQVGDACFGPTAPDGDRRCSDAVGEGVVPVGFSPVPV